MASDGGFDDAGVPHDADEDAPFDDADGGRGDSSGDVPKAERITPAQRQAWGVENFKNNAAFQIVAGCLVAIVFFALCEFCNSGDGAALSTAADTLKTFGLTALGFLFGKSVGGK